MLIAENNLLLKMTGVYGYLGIPVFRVDRSRYESESSALNCLEASVR